MVWSNEQRAFAVETYFSQSPSIVAVQRAFRTRYQIPSRDRVPDRNPILLWGENFRETGNVSEKKMRTTTDLSNTREHRGCQTVHFAVSQALCTQTTATTCKIFFFGRVIRTSHVVVSESKNKIFVSRIVFMLFTLKFTEVILPHPVYQITRRHHPGNVLLLMCFMISLHYSRYFDFIDLNVSELQSSAWLLSAAVWLSAVNQKISRKVRWRYCTCT